MADNITVTPGTGATIGADDVSGVLIQRVKVDLGGDGASSPLVRGQQAKADSLPVTLASDEDTLPISGTVTASGNLGLTRGDKTIAAVAPTASATLLLAANAGRLTAVLHNAGAQTVYLGPSNAVTTADGLPLLPGATLIDDRSDDAWYGITASGTGAVRVLEVA